MRFLMPLLCTTLPMAVVADAPAVMTDFGPTHSIVADLMVGVGKPDVLLSPTDNPHDFTLRPSQARLITQANIVIWVGPALTPWLTDPLVNLAPDATMLTLLDMTGWQALPIRDGHDHGDHDHDDDMDPHAWLDPQIISVWAQGIAEMLVTQDAANAEIYRDNLNILQDRLDRLSPQLDQMFRDFDGTKIIMPHDSFQYLEDRTGMIPAGYISASDDADPGPAHLRNLRDMVVSGAVTCVVADSDTAADWVALLTEGTDAKTAMIDVTDRNQAGYVAMITTLAETLRDCAD